MSLSRRRQFLIASSALLAAPLARAQSGRRYRLGVLWSASERIAQPYRAELLAGLRERGYVVERNLAVDNRYGEGNAARYEALAEELIALKPDVLVAGVDGVAIAMRRKTTTIPIVVLTALDLVENGLVQSFARPGTNVTGLSLRLDALVGKWFELLVELKPKIARVGFLNVAIRSGDPAVRSAALYEKIARKAASAKDLQLVIVAANDAASAQKAFEQLRNEGVEGLIVAPAGVTNNIREEIAAGARRLRIPAVSGLGHEFVEAGGLATYTTAQAEIFRYAAKFVDLILKGAKPADLPVEQLDKFELIVNLKTAREIGVAIPQTVLFRADRVIE
ncbi:MAG: ABC transporter substrate-binding protein [Acidobacteriota bacterium]